MAITISGCGDPTHRLTATKSLISGSIESVGDVLTFQVAVTNVGTSSVSSVLASDSVSPIVVTSDTDGLFGAGAVISSGSSSSTTYEYTVTQADVDNGLMNNVSISSAEAPSVSAREFTPSGSPVVPLPLVQNGSINASN